MYHLLSIKYVPCFAVILSICPAQPTKHPKRKVFLSPQIRKPRLREGDLLPDLLATHSRVCALNCEANAIVFYQFISHPEFTESKI